MWTLDELMLHHCTCHFYGSVYVALAAVWISFVHRLAIVDEPQTRVLVVGSLRRDAEEQKVCEYRRELGDAVLLLRLLLTSQDMRSSSSSS